MTEIKASHCYIHVYGKMLTWHISRHRSPYLPHSVYLLLGMTCTDGGEDNSPVHDTYHEDQVTLGSDLLDLWVYRSLENNLRVFVPRLFRQTYA